ncbi:hypothetical protein [Desulfogranum marinum]|uniref:hypothetical protein n=1 Tax=Desulfogranum marinum TaxID=453220 RepID=UPI0029C8C996|nr:hypothetical protein [Desulfogranum marinum]
MTGQEITKHTIQKIEEIVAEANLEKDQLKKNFHFNTAYGAYYLWLRLTATESCKAWHIEADQRIVEILF